MKLKLTEKQKLASDYIVENILRKPLVESPTGSGKTFILLGAALELIKKGYKVIISTPNNKLAHDGYTTALEYGDLESKDVGYLIGNSNYVDISKYQNCKNSQVLYEYITKESLERWEERFQGDEKYLLFDDFDEIVEYKDIAYSHLVKSLIVRDELDKENDFSQRELTYTNHFYLIHRATASKTDLSEFIVLFDEVHELPSVAEAVVQNRFSPFYLKHLLKNCLDEVQSIGNNFRGKATLEKDLTLGSKMVIELHNNVMKIPKQIGETASKETVVEMLPYLYKTDNEKMKSLTARVIKAAQKHDFKGKGRQVFQSAASELREMKEVFRSAKKMETGNNVSIFFSPSRGYPTFLTSSVSPAGVLKFKLWGKIKGGAGLSATLNTTSNYSDLSNKKFAYTRIGIDPSEAPEIKTYSRVFDKNKVLLVTKPIVVYKNNEDDDSEAILKWADEVARHVVATYKKRNSMVIAGSFAETEAIGLALEKLIPDTALTIAKSSMKTIIGIKNFIEKGGILVATRNYGTGISLNGKLLEMLYITKLPYPIATNKKWIDLKEKGESLYWLYYNNEMLTQLRQYFGRLQRTNEDSGEIHLLDARGIKDSPIKGNPNTRRMVDFFMSLYGVKKETQEEENVIKSSKMLNFNDEIDYFS